MPTKESSGMLSSLYPPTSRTSPNATNAAEITEKQGLHFMPPVEMDSTKDWTGCPLDSGTGSEPELSSPHPLSPLHPLLSSHVANCMTLWS